MAFRSLTTRLIFWTLLAGGGIFATTLVASNQLARRSAVAAAQLEAEQAADRLANRVRAVLVAVEESAQLLAASLETLQPDRAPTESLLRRFVASEDTSQVPRRPTRRRRVRGRGARGRRPTSSAKGDRTRARCAVDLAAARIPYTQPQWYSGPAATAAPRGPSPTSTR